MIEILRIKNLAVVEEVELELHHGFVVLTGETGAGKSIIVGSLKALVSGKGEADAIRTGQDRAKIEAMIDGKVVSLEIGRKRSRALLDGEMVPLRKLAEFSSSKIDIFGQRDHYFLLNSENHLFFLDDYLGLSSLREEVRRRWEFYQRALRRLKEAEGRRREMERERDLLVFQIQEIEAAGLREGEEEELLTLRELLIRKEKLREALSYLSSELEAEGGLGDRLWRVRSSMEELGKAFPEFLPHLEELEGFISSLSDVLRLVGEKIGYLEDEDTSLEKVEERLALIERLKRKYGESIGEVLKFKEKAEERLRHLEESFDLQKLRQEKEKAWGEFREAAEELSRLRREGKEKLEREVLKRLKKLAMERARFQVMFSGGAPSALGLEGAEFFFSANPGEELKPLKKVASGGELSRIMLALKSLFAGEGKTFVFDEIDAGIGGKTSLELGKMLRDISGKNQTIVVTHLPQVAAFAHQHFLVEKKVIKGRTYTFVREVKGQERVEELARMLAGEATPAALRSAEELLNRATSRRSS